MRKKRDPEPKAGEKRPRGPIPEHLKLEGDWERVVKVALSKRPPPRTPRKPGNSNGPR